MSVKNSMLAIPLQSIASSTIVAGGYSLPVSLTVSHSLSILRINNATTMPITISYDGVTDNEYLAAGQVLNLEAQTNSLPSSFACNIKNGTIIYFKGSAGTGNVYVSGYYQPIGV